MCRILQMLELVLLMRVQWTGAVVDEGVHNAVMIVALLGGFD